MSGKLDQSLDEIMKDRGSTGGRRGKNRPSARRSAPKATATVAVAGGVQKNTKLVKGAKTKTALSAVSMSGDSKITVSNLPQDVDERLIKDYFGSTVAPVKSVTLNYGPTGRSRGNATVVFAKPTAAAEAAALDGMKVDGRPMKIEVLLGAKSVPAPAAPKPLSERVSTKPKSAVQDKSKGAAVATKGTTKGTTGKGGRNSKKSGRAGRPKPKTSEELDAEMQDYFGGGGDANGNATNGAVQTTAAAATTANGDAGMEDEVM